MARKDFIEQLKALKYSPEDIGDNRVRFPFVIPVGKFIGQEVKLGFVVGDDFPANPPGGLHISPRLLPINPKGAHPTGGIHDKSPFGADWQYWSRPFPEWAKTDRTVQAYMAFIRRLFDTQ